jgi:hypothetical protein
MKLSYQQKGNYIYAKVPGESYRTDGKVMKKNSVYLGRVIDMENNVFFNKERGVFTYDISTGTYGEVDPSFQGMLKDDKRKKPVLILDFGDVYFVDSLIRDMHYDKVLDSISYGNKDTLWAMVAYYVLSNRANLHANTWQEGSFAGILYPAADLHSQRISRFLSELGKEETRRSYFQAHINWLKQYVCNDPAIIVDSTGLPNAIKMNLTQVSNHNGKISNEARLVTALQRDSGYPMMFRTVPGNIIDVTTLSATVTTLAEYGVCTDLALLDAGYVSSGNMRILFESGIDFIARLPENNKTLYNGILKQGREILRRPENLVDFNGRYVYAKQIECSIDEYTAYAYLCLDVDASGDENHKAIKHSRKRRKGGNEMHRVFETSGMFVIISSIPYQAEEILSVYYMRQLVEQYFDLGKGMSRLTPLRVHNEQRVPGHLLLSQVAATIHLHIQKKMKSYYENSVEMFMGLRNRKCIVYTSRIVTNEGQSNATQYYNKFNIKYPVYFDKSGDALKPCYGMPKLEQQ